MVVGSRTQQYLAAQSASLLVCNGGMGILWTSAVDVIITDNELSEDEEDFPIGRKITMNQWTTVTSILMFGAVFGNILVAPIIDNLGRKIILLLCGVPMLLSWIMIMLAQSIWVICLARFITGLFSAISVAVVVVYIGEITEPAIRGQMSVLSILMVEIGGILIIIAGTYVSYKAIAFIGSMVPILFLVTFYFMPESPYYFIQKGNYQEAEKSLKRLRGNGNITEELKDIQYNVEHNKNDRGTCSDLFSKKYRKALFLALAMKTFQQMNGATAIQSYMAQIFEETSTGLDTNTSILICICVTIPASFVASYLVEKLGRKPSYYISSLGCTFALLCEVVYFYLQDSQGQDMTSLGWLPITGLFSFFICKCFGLINLPYILLSELFPPNIKGRAISLALFYGSFVNFLVMFSFGFWAKLGLAVVFLLYACFCFASFLFVSFFIPETKGKTFNDIQADVIKDE